MWLKISTYQKRAEYTVQNGKILNLREQQHNIAWNNERVFTTMNSFMWGSYANKGTYIFNANPLGDNHYKVVSSMVVAQNGNWDNGLIRWSGNQYNPTIENHFYNGTVYAFSFMMEFLSKNNGLIGDCGFDIFIGGDILGRYRINGNNQYMQNLMCGDVNTGGWNGAFGFRPIGNLQFKRSYENLVVHYMNIWTQPIRLHEQQNAISVKCLALEGDM